MNVVCILNGSCHVVVVQSCVNNSMSRATVLVSPFDGGAVAMLFIDFAQELQLCRERSNINQTLEFQNKYQRSVRIVSRATLGNSINGFTTSIELHFILKFQSSLVQVLEI